MQMLAGQPRAGDAPDFPERALASFHAELRGALRHEHEAVDQAFSRFALDERAGYAAFLRAHARILPAIERLIDPAELIPGWIGRSEALAADLAALGEAMPEPPAGPLFAGPPPGMPERWGSLYVIEGSRLGGVVLARSVPTNLPTAYLSAAHPRGAWRDILGRIDRAAGGAAWRAAAIEAGRRVFRAYGEAAAAERGSDER